MFEEEGMKTKEVVDDVTMNRAITRITYEIIERNKDLNKLVLAGIKTRGVHLARRIQKQLAQCLCQNGYYWNSSERSSIISDSEPGVGEAMRSNPTPYYYISYVDGHGRSAS